MRKESTEVANKFDVNKIRADFPILNREVHGKPLVYLDNAATTQKPRRVIEAVSNYYSGYNSNIHRGVHLLSQEATNGYEGARETVRKFINAASEEEIIFTRGATEAINLVASTYGGQNFSEGDEIIISHMEHHANIVPWQLLREKKGIVIKVIPIDDNGELIYEDFLNLFSSRTKLLSVVHVSNSLGTINPVEDIIRDSHERGVPVMIDASQSIQHLPLDVRKLNCEFLAFSGHKVYAPTGIGALYVKKQILKNMPPYQGGGDMISTVSFEETRYNDLPFRFEAGTQNIAGAIGLAEALKYISEIGLENIAAYESELMNYGMEALSQVPYVKIIGTAKEKSGAISFVMDSAHPHDVGTMLDLEGVAVRTGHHCTEPLMRRFGVPATTRASFSFYNTTQEINVLIKSLKKVHKMFA